MNSFIHEHNKNLQNYHLKNKIYLKNAYTVPVIDNITIGIKLTKIPTLKNFQILENLLLIELLSNQKGFIKSYKKKFKEIDLFLKTDLKYLKKDRFLELLSYFYLPIIKRRSLKVPKLFDKNFNYLINISDFSMLPFVPNRYFKWNKLINTYIYLKNSKKKTITQLLLNYYNFF